MKKIKELTKENDELRLRIQCLETNLHLTTEQERYSIEARKEVIKFARQFRNMAANPDKYEKEEVNEALDKSYQNKWLK